MTDQLLADRAHDKLGSNGLYLINVLLGLGVGFVDVIDILARHGLDISHREIFLARSWWCQMLPTPSLRRFARRLVILLSNAAIHEAKGATRPTDANRRFKKVLNAVEDDPLSPITIAELEDIDTLSRWNGIHNGQLHHPWAAEAAYAQFYLRSRKVPPASVVQARHRFKFWLNSEYHTVGQSLSGAHTSFFLNYMRWLTENYNNPLDTDRNRK